MAFAGKNEIKQDLQDNFDENEERAMKIITSKEFSAMSISPNKSKFHSTIQEGNEISSTAETSIRIGEENIKTKIVAQSMEVVDSEADDDSIPDFDPDDQPFSLS